MDHDETVERRLCALLADRSGEVNELAIGTRRAVAKLAKDCSEMLYQTYAVSDVFTYSGKLGQAFIHISTYSGHVNLGFNQGTQLADSGKLMEGTGKLIRHVKIKSLSTLKKPAVKQLIREAMELGKEMAEGKGGIVPQTFVDKSK